MASGLLPSYLVVGADELKRQTAESRLKARLDAGLAAFNLDERTAGPDLDPGDLALSLNTLPIGDTFRLVVIHDAGKLAKPVSEMIVSYLANPNPDCVLLLVAESLKKTTRLYKAVAGVGKRSIIDCSPISARDLPAYLQKHAQAMGLVLDRDAARELVSRAGESTTLLDAHLKTLGELCAETRRITYDDVVSHVTRTAEVKPWDFVDAVAAGDAATALELFHTMQDPSILGLVTLTVRRVRELACCRAFIDRGEPSRAAGALGRPDWLVKRYLKDARRLTQRQLASCVCACERCERQVKGGVDPETALVTLVLHIANPTERVPLD